MPHYDVNPETVSRKWREYTFHFEIYNSKCVSIALKSSTMVGENFEIYNSKFAEIALKSSMVGENFEI